VQGAVVISSNLSLFFPSLDTQKSGGKTDISAGVTHLDTFHGIFGDRMMLLLDAPISFVMA
jgi:hypothetical protein